MPAAKRPAPDFAFHGLQKLPIFTSSTKLPLDNGSDHSQQNPAVNRPVYPFATCALIALSNEIGFSKILNSNSSRIFHRTFAVRSISRVLLTQLIKGAEPAHRNCVSRTYS